MSKQISAQDLYDWRERTAEISGSDLHELFRELLDGEPSPEGARPISVKKLGELARNHGDTVVGAAAAAFASDWMDSR
jgi:hypothetical protein